MTVGRPEDDLDLLIKLPRELREKVLLYLDLGSLEALSRCNRAWYELIDASEHVWMRLCHKHRIGVAQYDNSRTWKECFRAHYPRARYISCWLEGKFSRLKVDDPLPPGIRWCPLDAQTWGEILDAEMSR